MTSPQTLTLDALFPTKIPVALNPRRVGAYIDHSVNPASYRQAVARFPLAVVFSIASRPWTRAGQVADCESTDFTPDDCPAWAVDARSRGQIPTVYVSFSQWAAVAAAFYWAGVAPPQYWIADYDEIAELPAQWIAAGAIGKQYTDYPTLGNPYDGSVMLDYVPGIDPTPAPPVPPITEDDPMLLCAYNQAMWCVRLDLTGRVHIPGGGSVDNVKALQSTGRYTSVPLGDDLMATIPIVTAAA